MSHPSLSVAAFSCRRSWPITGTAGGAWPSRSRDTPQRRGHRAEAVPRSVAVLDTYARYGETVGSPATQNRHGTSAASRTPVLGPERITRGDTISPRLTRSGDDAPQTSAPFSVRSMPSAWQSLAGPLARSLSPACPVPASLAPTATLRLLARRACAMGTPEITRPARSSTAAGVPSPRQTRLTQKCMP